MESDININDRIISVLNKHQEILEQHNEILNDVVMILNSLQDSRLEEKEKK